MIFFVTTTTTGRANDRGEIAELDCVSPCAGFGETASSSHGERKLSAPAVQAHRRTRLLLTRVRLDTVGSDISRRHHSRRHRHRRSPLDWRWS